MNDKIRKFLDKVTVVPDEIYLKQLQDGAFLICPLIEEDVSGFTDNLTGPCIVCSKTLVFRPYNELATHKICIQCAIVVTQSGVQ